MIQIQVVPREGVDAFKLLRSKVLHEAATWYWANKKKTRLKHLQSDGHIDISHGGGVVMARIVPKAPRDLFYLGEKFIGRMVAWFEDELSAINVQLLDTSPPVRRPRRRKKQR